MSARRHEAGKCEGCGQRTDRIARAGSPSGGPVHSIRKNSFLPGSGPTDLHYGKNGLVLSGVERTGPPSGGPARVVRRGWAGCGRERGANRATGTRSAETAGSASMIGLAGG